MSQWLAPGCMPTFQLLQSWENEYLADHNSSSVAYPQVYNRGVVGSTHFVWVPELPKDPDLAADLGFRPPSFPGTAGMAVGEKSSCLSNSRPPRITLGLYGPQAWEGSWGDFPV